MSEEIDVYYEWLGIKPEDQPPNHYQLLGVDLFESDENVLARAADERMVYVRTFATGRHSKRSQGLLNEIAAAKLCLLDEKRRNEYDETLKSPVEPPVDVEMVAEAPDVAPPTPPPTPPVGVAVVEAPSQTATVKVAPAAGVSSGAPSTGTYRRRKPKNNIGGIVAGAAIAVVLAIIVFAVLGGRDTKGPLSGSDGSKKPGGSTSDGSASPKTTTDGDFQLSPPTKKPRNGRQDNLPNRRNSDDELFGRDPTEPIVDTDWPDPIVLPDPIDKKPLIEEPPEKQAVPSDAALGPVVARVEHFFDIKGAATEQDKRALAQQLFETSLQSDAYLEQFVMLERARELAVAANDLKMAIESVNQQSKLFKVDQLGLLGNVVSAIEYSDEQPKENAALALVGLRLIDSALAEDRYELAKEIATTVTRSARQSTLPDLPQQAQEVVRRIRLVQRPFEQLKPSLEALAADPDDEEANVSVGRFYCFVKGDWRKGLPHLAKGNHAQQKQLSEREIANGRLPEATAAIAQGWFELADDEEALLPASIAMQQENIRRHSLSLYESALPRLPDSKKAQARSQVAAIKDKLGGASGASSSDSPRNIWYMNEVSMQPYEIGGKRDGALRQTTNDPRAPFRGTGVFFRQNSKQRDLIYKIEWDRRIRQIIIQVKNTRKFHILLLDHRTERPLGNSMGPYSFGSSTKSIAINVPASVGRRFYLHLHNEASSWFYVGGIELR
jgi:hypothetical protein